MVVGDNKNQQQQKMQANQWQFPILIAMQMQGYNEGRIA